MRRTVGVVATCFLAIALVAPASGSQSSREVTKEYSMANGMVMFNSAEAYWSLGTALHVFRPNTGERFVSLSIVDDSGFPARAHVHLDANGDGEVEHLEDFCNETPKPIEIGQAKKIEVGVVFGTCPDETGALVTQGKITATFSK